MFGPPEGKFFEKFKTVARSNDKFKYFHVVNGKCGADEYGATEYPGLMLTRDFEQPVMHYKGELNEHAILFWMEVLSVPQVVRFSEDYADTIFKMGRTTLILFADDLSEDSAYL